MMIVIIALLVILLGTIGFVSVYALRVIGNPAAVASEAASEAENESTIPSQENLVSVDYATPIKGLITDSNDGTHAITFKVSIGVDNSEKKLEKDIEELQALLTSRENVVKSFISEIIYHHDHGEFGANSGAMQATLESEILERLQLEFASDKIVAVYLSDYLYQSMQN
jgi:flagellar basal body-associated protein FliL